MPTVIDSLVVELGLDSAKFTRGQREAMDSLRKMETEATKRGRQVEQAASGIEQGFAAVQKRMLGVAALFLGGMGIEQFIQRVTRLQTATANLAQVTGISGQTFQAWAAAAERFGVSGSGVVQGLQSLNSQQQRFKAGNPGAFGLFNMSLGTRGAPNAANRLEINPYTDSTEQIALKAAKWLENSKDKPRDAQALIDAGMSQDLVTLAAKGTKALQAALAETKKIVEVDAKAFQDLTAALAETQQKAEAVGRTLVKEMIPGLLALLSVFNKFIDLIPNAKPGNGRKFSTPEDAARDLHRRMHGGLDEQILRKEAEIKANEEKLRDAKGIYRRPIEQEQQQLIEELRKLREQLQKERAAGASPTSLGGVGGTSARLIQTAFGGGGAEFGGGVGSGTNAFGGARSGMGNADQGGGGSGPMGGVLPDVPGGAIDRGWAREELKRNPALRDKILRIAANEQGKNRLGTTAIIESLMNRAQQRRIPLEKSARWVGEPYGYYARGSMGRGALENKGHRQVLEQALENALNGSNVSDYATDNSSQGLAARERASGKFTFHKMINGESFFSPGWGGGKGGAASRSAYERWRRGIAAEAVKKKNPTAESPASGPQSWDQHLIDGARSTAWGGGMGSGSQAVNVGDIHIHKPVGDVEDLASNVRGNVQRIARIVSANYGPA